MMQFDTIRQAAKPSSFYGEKRNINDGRFVTVNQFNTKRLQ